MTRQRARAAADRVTLIRPGPQHLSQLLADYAGSAGLFVMLVRRTVLIRYGNTAVGLAWAALQPAALMLVFTIFLGHLARVPSDGIAYPLFFATGIWVWNLAAQAVSQGSASVAANGHIVGKVWFPRALLPATAVAVALIDMAAAAPAILLVMLASGAAPDPLGVLVFLAALASAAALLLGLALWSSALQALYRDTAYIVPFALQLWMFLSPVIYPASLVPPDWRALYALNPLVPVVEAARFAFAGGPPPRAAEIAAAAAVSLLLLLLGHRFFRRREALLADAV